MTFKMRGASFVMLEALIILVYFNPIADLLPSFMQIVVFVMWVLFCMKKQSMWNESIRLSILNIFIFVFTLFRCIIADQLNTDYYSTFQVVIARYQLLIYPILFVYVKNLSIQNKKRIFTLAFLCIVGTILVSLYYIAFVDPQAIRNTQRDVALFGVGDFMLMYAMAIVVGPLLFLIIERIKQKKKSKLLVITFGLIILCLILCNLVTSVVVAIISIFVMFAVRKRKRMGIILIPFFALLALMARTHFANLLYYIADQNWFYWSTNNKIIAIANVLSGDMTNIDTLSRRFMLASWSLNSFKEHPFFGINWRNHVYGKIGCHMQWADDLGRYGLIGNLFLIVNYIQLVRKTVKHITNTFVQDALVTAWILFFILGFLNPCLSATNLMMILVVIPTFEVMLPENNNHYSGE